MDFLNLIHGLSRVGISRDLFGLVYPRSWPARVAVPHIWPFHGYKDFSKLVPRFVKFDTWYEQSGAFEGSLLGLVYPHGQQVWRLSIWLDFCNFLKIFTLISVRCNLDLSKLIH